MSPGSDKSKSHREKAEFNLTGNTCSTEPDVQISRFIQPACNLTVWFDCVEKPDHPEEAHLDTGFTAGAHIEI